MATRKMLDLSTAHAPSATPGFGKHRVVSTEYGWVVFVPGVPSREAPDTLKQYETPDWLVPIMATAMVSDCALINFDRDAEIEDRFKTYDW